MTTEKHIKVTGSSNISWKDAIIQTVAQVSNTIDHLATVTVLEQRARIENDKIAEYFVDLDISFQVDDRGKKNKKDEQQDTSNQ